MYKTTKKKHDQMQAWIDKGDVVRQWLDDDGHKALHRLAECGLSLRAVGRKTGLSASYLSQIKNCTQRISPASYVQLLKLEMTKGK